MQLTFWGAAGTVTGSAHLMTVNGVRVLLDCGLYQGRRDEARRYNQEFPAPPPAISDVILSHAHLDHCGNLPVLVRQGFKGSVRCTHATADLVKALLLDSGHIQEKDAEYLNRKKRRAGEPPVSPLYTLRDTEAVFARLKTAHYGRPFRAGNGAVTAVFRDAGHILGSAFVEMTVADGSPEGKKILFSGDLGRRNRPILRDPETPGEADILILESTYGNRCHRPAEGAEERLLTAIWRVIERRGKIVIPAFSIERTQELVYTLNKLWNERRLPRVPVYVDSPLATNVTEIFRAHAECLDEQVQDLLRFDPDPFGFESLIYTRDVAASKRINLIDAPCIIISASGMAEAGRVLHHLANTISDPKNAVFIVGFMAQNTLGRKLVEGEKEVRILGDHYTVRAEIVVLNDYSGHADADELRAFARQVAVGGRLRHVFLVHGDPIASEMLRDALKDDLPGVEITVPARGDTFDV
jgi:metallo-beta-lactamase family protein